MNISEEVTRCNQEKSEYFKKHEDQPNHFTNEGYGKICDISNTVYGILCLLIMMSCS